jgi:hypothetical protein
MAHGNYNGMTEKDAAFRALFSRDSVLASDWYKARLAAKQKRDETLWARHRTALEQFIASKLDRQEIKWRTRLCAVSQQLDRVRAAGYLHELAGTIGLEPSIFE